MRSPSSETLAVFSFQGAVALIFHKTTIPGIGLSIGELQIFSQTFWHQELQNLRESFFTSTAIKPLSINASSLKI